MSINVINKSKNYFLILTIGCMMMAVISSCGEEVAYDVAPVPKVISFQKNIQPILSEACFPCHDKVFQTKDIVLDGYTNVIRFVKDGSLMGSITWQPEFRPMPRNKEDSSIAERMSDTDIDTIQEWIAAGMKNN